MPVFCGRAEFLAAIMALQQWQYYLEGVKSGVTVVTNPRAQHLLRQKTRYATVMSSDGMVVESWQELQA